MKLLSALKLASMAALLSACGVDAAGLGELIPADAGATPVLPGSSYQTTVDHSPSVVDVGPAAPLPRPQDAGVAFIPRPQDAGVTLAVDAAPAEPLGSANDASVINANDGGALTPSSFESPSIQDGGSIPELHTCVGRDISPALSWSPGADGTRSYAIVLRNLDAKGSDPAVLWVVWNIPSTVTSIPQDIGVNAYPPAVPGAAQVSEGSTFARHYNGPCGKGKHRYELALYALSSAQIAASVISAPWLVESAVLRGGVLEKRTLVATFTGP